MIKEVEEVPSGDELKRRSLVALLKPDDVIMFKSGGKKEYILVRKVKDGVVYGDYLKISGRRKMSLDEVATRDPRVAYLQKILSTQ